MSKFRKRFLNVLVSNCSEFCRSTTIHGLNHLIAPRRSIFEKLFWSVSVCVVIALGTDLIYRSYVRYENNPVVVSINKDYFSWTVTFPGTTWCLLNKLDRDRAVNYIKKKWDVSKGKQFQEYLDFLDVLVNSNYRELKKFSKFVGNKNLEGLDLQAVMKDVNFQYFNFSIVTYFGGTFPYHEVLTEEGICYTTSVIAAFISTDATARDDPKIQKDPEICMFQQLPCFARVRNIPKPLKYYVHSAYEIPDSRSKFWLVQEDLGIDTYFSFLNMKAHSSLEDLRPQQRKCNLREETFPSSESSLYSFRLCQMNCRRRLSMELCKCVPHFYVKRADQRPCNLEGLVCLSNYSEYLITLGAKNGSEKYPCECYPSCSETEFILESTKYITWKEFFISGIRYSWYIDLFPKIAVVRHVIFGFEGLLVNLGGIAGFFVGSSIVSIIEFVYFFTIRLFRRLLKEFASRPNRQTRKEEKTVRLATRPEITLRRIPNRDFEF